MLHRNAAAWLALMLVALAAPQARASAAVPACSTDAFSGTTLDSARWSVLRPADASLSVADGRLRLPLRPGALAGAEATAENVVLQAAPPSGWTALTRVGIAAIDEPGERAGIVVWRSEGEGRNGFATATFMRTGAGAARFEALTSDRSVLARPLDRSGVAAPAGLPPAADVLLRVRSDSRELTAAYSTDDGATWTAFGEPAQLDGPVRVGLLGIGGGGHASFDDFTLSCGPQVQLASAPDRGVATLEVGVSAALSDDRDDQHALHLAWDFGDGATGEGSQLRLHRYREPGTYRPTLRATDSDGNVTSVARSVTVLASDPPCPAAADAFSGNGLDARWAVLRPVPTGLEVHDGRLWLRPYDGELLGASATARNVVLRPAPAGPWTMTTTVDVAALDAAGDQAGLLLWRGEAPNDFAKLAFRRTGPDAFELVRAATTAGTAAAHAATPPGPARDGIRLRIDSSGTQPPVFTASGSTDGVTWTPVGAPFGLDGAGQLELGVLASGTSVSGPAGFDELRLEGPQPCGARDTLPPETTHVLEPQPDGTVRVTLAAVDDVIGSGVARTEHRTGDGAFVAYHGPFSVTAPGEHLLEYRSVDRSGNVEAARRLRVVIDGGPLPPEGSGAPAAAVPRGIGDRRPAVRPMVRITAPVRSRLRAAALLRSGIRVRAACRAVGRVRVTLAVRPRVARRLGLARRTLASRVVRCAERLRVRLAPRGRARRVLRRTERTFAARIEVRAGPLRDRREVVFR